MDAHVHLRGETGLADAAGAGVIALRDAGTKAGTGLTAGRPGMPAVISAGWALVAKDGYGSFLGTAVGTPSEIHGEIARLKTAGAAIIKVVASGVVSLKEPGRITPGGFAAADLRLIVDAAAGAGLAVMAHANGEDAVIACARAGVRSVEHGFFLTDRALDEMARRGTFWVPTVGALVRAADQAGVAPAVKTFIGRTIADHIAMLGRAFAFGVPLAVGTDCVLPDPRYREAYEAELAYFRQAGIPAEAVDRIATEGGRKLLGIVQPRMIAN